MKIFVLAAAFLVLAAPLTEATSLVAGPLKCALCGSTSQQQVLQSSNTLFGSSDLDGRPAEMLRSTMDAWVHECPTCGYCSYDITERIDGADEVLKTDAYTKTLSDKEVDALTRRFLCIVQIFDAAGDGAAALEHLLYASWAADDAGNTTKATEIRLQILGRLEAIMESGRQFREDVAGDRLLASDVARRASNFDKASFHAKAGLLKDPEGDMRKFLRYELELIAKRDSGAHEAAAALQEVSPQDGARQPGAKVEEAATSEADKGTQATNAISSERMAEIQRKSLEYQAAGRALTQAMKSRDQFDWAAARSLYTSVIQDHPGTRYAETAKKQLDELNRQAAAWRSKRMHVYAWWPILEGKSMRSVRNLLGAPDRSWNSDNTWIYENQAVTQNSGLSEDLEVFFEGGVVTGVKSESVYSVFSGGSLHYDAAFWSQVQDAAKDRSPHGTKRLIHLLNQIPKDEE